MKTLVIGLFFLSLIIPSYEFVYKAKEIKSIYREVFVEVSAYTSSVDETDDTPFLTASQTRVREGIIACPRNIEFGTKVEIEGKIYVCEDRMNIRYKEEFDIWVETKELAYNWGRRKVEVKIY